MDLVSRVASTLCNALRFPFSHLLNPHPNNFFQLASSEITKRRILPPFLTLLFPTTLSQFLCPHLQSLSQLFRQARKIILARKSAQDDENLSPFLDIRKLDNVAQIARNDTLEQPQVRAFCEIGLLSLGEELGTTFNGEEDSIGITLGRQAQLNSRIKVAKHKGFGNESIDGRFSVGVDLESAGFASGTPGPKRLGFERIGANIAWRAATDSWGNARIETIAEVGDFNAASGAGSVGSECGEKVGSGVGLRDGA
jgi:hypothetical protein